MDKKIGIICALASFLIWAFIVVVIVTKLPVKADTFILLSWPVLPGIVGGLAFQKKDREKSW